MIKKFSELSEVQKEQFIDLFADSFLKDLDKKGTYEAQEKVIFLDAILPEFAAAFIIDDTVAGLVMFSNMHHSSVRFSRELCRQQIGKFYGSFTYNLFRAIFETPTAEKEDEGYIDFLCVHQDFRRRGIATQLLEYAYAQENKPYYILGVLCKNERAKNLYVKQGYTKTKTKRGLFRWLIVHDGIDMMKLKRST